MSGRRDRPTPLATLRTLFLAFSLAVVVISLVAVPVLAAGTDPDGGSGEGPDPTVPAAGVFVLGLVLYVAARQLSRPDRFRACRSPAEVLAMFRVQFILQLALAETSLLVGFVGFIVTGSVLPYVVGAAWTVLGFLRIAPTRHRLVRLQDDIALRGCAYQLLDALDPPVLDPPTAADWS